MIHDNTQLHNNEKKGEKRGQAPFFKEHGIRPYPYEAREIRRIKVAFLDDKA